MKEKTKEELQEELEEAKERIHYLESRLKHTESHSKRLYSELQRKGFRRIKRLPLPPTLKRVGILEEIL